MAYECKKNVKYAALAAGTKTYASYDCGVTWEKVSGFTAVGDVGEMQDTQETTTLEDSTRTYIGALATPSNKQLVGNLNPADANQSKLIEAAKVGETIMLKIVMPTTPKTIGINRLVLLGFQINGPTPEATIQFTIGAQASGKTFWSTDSDIDLTNMAISAITNTVEMTKTLQLTLMTVPDNATIAAGQITYEAMNPAIATVSNDGLISGVTAGDFGIHAVDAVSGIETFWFGRCVPASSLSPITVNGSGSNSGWLSGDTLTVPGSASANDSVTLVTAPVDAAGVLSGSGASKFNWDNTARTLKITDVSASATATLTFTAVGHVAKVISVGFVKA